MNRIDKVVRLCERILALVWYGGIFAIYILALIQAFSLELTAAVGVVLVLWPFVLVLSVRMEKENLLYSIPVLQARKIEGWGMLSFPTTWQVEGKDILVFQETENVPRAIVYRKEQLPAVSTFHLPDHTLITVKVPHHMLSKSKAVLRCRYIMGENKGIGYFCAVRHMDVYFISVVFCGNRIGKYIAEKILDEARDEFH